MKVPESLTKMIPMTGIKHYTTTTKGIGGQIKRRISDFIVRETTPEGRHLSNEVFGEWEPPREQKLEVPWQPEGTEYLHVTMEKFNLDTNEALRRVSRALYVSPKRIGYAGMKDRRAITVQRISIWNPDAQRLAAFRSRYVSLREPEWRQGRIEIGDLKGNGFEVTVRGIEMGEEELRRTIGECFSEMTTHGVANYFGEQRFGGAREITHRVGKEFIKGNLEGAVMLYLTGESKSEEQEIADARKSLAENKDFARALREFPAKFRYERSILHHLSVHPRDFVGAFQKLPKHLTYLFTHAYQSYIFNEIINARIETGIGLGPCEGDILEDGEATAALPGFDSALAEGRPGEAERSVLEKEGVKPEDFRVKSFMELSCSGGRKKIVLRPHEPRLIGISADECNEGKIKAKIGFWLEKGNYATTILRELHKLPYTQEKNP
ncbi:MAG: tRNA pseudouridine(13) synthase TruD [Candidatus Diapherotrites archaeon]|uniref:Probable tRNA pseudouridine synthase D n=1 Tax=Candidatus Iainarchaeum sp. TaxID=3101447 RepID=A0A8T3YR42_9ARCH|nr:tRNA pseudouridine(13) synthase TruD [Candidatus Diapherotrites archaeon]